MIKYKEKKENKPEQYKQQTILRSAYSVVKYPKQIIEHGRNNNAQSSAGAAAAEERSDERGRPHRSAAIPFDISTAALSGKPFDNLLRVYEKPLRNWIEIEGFINPARRLMAAPATSRSLCPLLPLSLCLCLAKVRVKGRQRILSHTQSLTLPLYDYYEV